MAHTIQTEDLTGVFEVLIASSSKERKRLFIQTDVNDGQADTAFVIKIKDEEVASFEKLRDAIEKYNSIGYTPFNH